METAATGFYVTGGTLRADAPSYVERRADRDLYDALTRGEYCYILTARQMGKSSLMARTAVHLRREGVAVVLLDLTAIGQNLSPEQWYDGLRDVVGSQLSLDEELDDFWRDQSRFGPLQRWMKALREIVLDRVPGPIVIFIDEIDAVRSLPFSTDEFFAAIRECYNRRTDDPEFVRLTFCLLGVASPSDLIQDTRITPFNIGRRIELTDFSADEALPLAAGLLQEGEFTARSLRSLEPQRTPRKEEEKAEEEARRLLQRVLYWTGGHPYLTQRLCRALAEAESIPASSSSASGSASSASPAKRAVKPFPSQRVDQRCEELFLSPRARERDDNLLFVREHLLRPWKGETVPPPPSEAGGADLASLLDLYARVWRGERVADDETNPLVSLLRLSGITRSGAPPRTGGPGQLRVRNRIYAKVFDRAWVQRHMPDAELRRQRAAYRRGVLRATSIAGLVLVVVASLALSAVTQAHRAKRERGVANRQRELADRQRQRAEEREQIARQYLYASQVKLADQSLTEGNLGRALELLESQRPAPGQEDLRGFEWRYLWRLCQGDPSLTLRGHPGGATSVAFSPDGRILASGGGDRLIRLWEVGTWREIGILKGHADWINSVAFSPDGKRLASAGGVGTVRLWDVAGRRAVTTLPGHTKPVNTVAFSPDGSLLASGGDDGEVRVWSLSAETHARALAAFRADPVSVIVIAFSPDSKTLAIGGGEATIKLWEIATRRTMATLAGHTDRIQSLAFSPDGKILASSSPDRMVKLWDLTTRQERDTLWGSQTWVNSLAFSPDSRRLATGSADYTVQLWDLATRREVTVFRERSEVASVAFSPDGKWLASASSDGTVKVWRPVSTPAAFAPGRTGSFSALAFSPDLKMLVAGNAAGTISLWDVLSRRQVATLGRHERMVTWLAFSPDGRSLASGSTDKTVKLWDLLSRTEKARFSRFAATLEYMSGFPHSVSFSADGRRLAVSCLDDTVKLWDIASRHVIASIPGRGSVALSPDGKTLAVKSGIRVTLWDLASHHQLGRLNGFPGFGHDVLFSPDSRALATGGYETTRLWNLATKQPVTTMRGPRASTQFAVFSPDGRTLATWSSNIIRLWHRASGQEVATLRGHTGAVIAAAFSPDGQTLASASGDGEVRLWRSASFREADPLQMIASGGGDRGVMLQWRPVPSSMGYSIYRRAAAGQGSPWVRLTPRPIIATSFIDRGSHLVNGRSQVYAVAAAFRGATGGTVEGTRVTSRATPVAVPSGFMGCSVNEGRLSGSVTVDAGRGEIRIRGSGNDIWLKADEFYFLSRPWTDDVQITATLLARPTATHEYAKAGLMVRETLDPSARYVLFEIPARHDANLNCRPVVGDDTDQQGGIIPNAALRLPITLRLTRRGNTIVAAYSWDQGKSFQTAGEPFSFDPPLAPTLYVGLAVTSHDATKITEARFRNLVLEKP